LELLAGYYVTDESLVWLDLMGASLILAGLFGMLVAVSEKAATRSHMSWGIQENLPPSKRRV
jgi:hypothetical protein